MLNGQQRFLEVGVQGLKFDVARKRARTSAWVEAGKKRDLRGKQKTQALKCCSLYSVISYQKTNYEPLLVFLYLLAYLLG